MLFMPPPEIVTTDRESTIYLIRNTKWLTDAITMTKVKSVFICDLIRKGNFMVNRAAEEAVALELRDEFPTITPQVRNAIKWLCYNARNYNDHDNLVSEGYQPFTQAMILEAYRQGKNIEFPDGKIGTVKRATDGNIKAFIRAKVCETGAMYPARITQRKVRRPG